MTAKRTSTQPRLLVVDDDAQYGKWLSYHLGVFCPDSSVTLFSHTEFDRWCETDAGHDCDIVLITALFGSSPEDPKAKGLEILRRLRGRAIFPAVLMVAEEGNELTAVRALQLGAVDYLPKRLLTPDRLNTSVRLAVRRIEKRVQRKLASAPNVTGIVVAPPPEEETREQPQINSTPAAPAVVPVAAPAEPIREESIAPAPKAESVPVLKVDSTPVVVPIDIKAGAALPSEHTYTATGVDFRAEDEPNTSGEELVAALLRIGEQVDKPPAEKAAVEKPAIEKPAAKKITDRKSVV